MSEYFDASFVIVHDIVDDLMYSQIIEEVKLIYDDVVSIIRSTVTNTIEASSHWDQFEVEEKIKK
jgi:hypothetical protein